MANSKKIHFIGIGSNILRDMAIGLKESGHSITGSDEEISPVTESLLQKTGLRPEKNGWFPEKIDGSTNAVIIGPHARADNPELKRAQELKLHIYSYPDFIFEQSRDKQRVVVTGSHGKTMITSMMIHVMNYHHRKFDYLVTAPVVGLKSLVKLSDAPLIIIEGQEVMASSIDPTPAFLKYHHHIGVVSGVEWQESEIYPTKEGYVKQFGLFASATPKSGVLVYFEFNPVLAAISTVDLPDVLLVPYKTPMSANEGGQEFLITPTKERLPLKVTGKPILQSISAAQEALKKIGITTEMFNQAITSFTPVGS